MTVKDKAVELKVGGFERDAEIEAQLLELGIKPADAAYLDVREKLRGGGAQASEAPCAPRLEQGTYKDQEKIQGGPSPHSIINFEPISGESIQWVIDITDFGEGDVEVVAYQYEPRKPGGVVKKGSGDRSQMKPENLSRAEKRARKTVRHKIMKMKADRMLTLTTRESIEDRFEFQAMFQRFTRLCRKQFGDFTYVAVFEKQERGAYHAHLALNEFYNVNMLRRLWRKAVTGSYTQPDANVDMTSPRRGIWSRHRIARYLTKYMLKDVDSQTMNCKRYFSGGKIEKPRKLRVYMRQTWDVFFMVRAIAEKVVGKPMKKMWESPMDGGREIYWFATY